VRPEVFNAEFNKILKENPNVKQDIVKLQALVRGHLVRKKVTGFTKKHNTNESTYVENYKFPNGAIYTGTL
jgi:predicted SnoaL-like aldol condensation-catalyzing enzyme